MLYVEILVMQTQLRGIESAQMQKAVKKLEQ